MRDPRLKQGFLLSFLPSFLPIRPPITTETQRRKLISGTGSGEEDALPAPSCCAWLESDGHTWLSKQALFMLLLTPGAAASARYSPCRVCWQLAGAGWRTDPDVIWHRLRETTCLQPIHHPPALISPSSPPPAWHGAQTWPTQLSCTFLPRSQLPRDLFGGCSPLAAVLPKLLFPRLPGVTYSSGKAPQMRML